MGLRIQRLSSSVANQIAAGEVIERPASVVKELLENALDAKASHINIDIGFGGLNQIRISDDGQGILADDLPLALAAHATSKLTTLNDLYTLDSMGFRGEALASIASISRLSLSSKPSQQQHAMMISVDGEEIYQTPCARNQGTTVDVRDIFFNAPVRKMFLKTARHEYQAIESVVKRFALSAPQVGLTLKHNDKQTLLLPAALCEASILLRVQKIFGTSFLNQAIYLNIEHAGMCLRGWISSATYQRSQQDKQWLYINQRMVKDKLIGHAIKQSYGTLLHPGRHPSWLLYLTLSAAEVDVNVHPTKYEVRFQQPRLVHDLIASTILQALSVDNSTCNGIIEPTTQIINAPLPNYREVFTRESMHNSGEVFIFNAQFLVICLHEQPYLIDVMALQYYRTTELFAHAIYPLASRPLLLPKRYTIDEHAYAQIDALLPILEKFGIHLDFISATCVILRAIPLELPSLELTLFIEEILQIKPVHADVGALLVRMQSIDARQLTRDELQEIMNYLQVTPAAREKTCVLMDVLTCQGLMHA